MSGAPCTRMCELCDSLGGTFVDDEDSHVEELSETVEPVSVQWLWIPAQTSMNVTNDDIAKSRFAQGKRHGLNLEVNLHVSYNVCVNQLDEV